MDYVRLERDGDVAIVSMARGKANALNAEMVEELLAALGGAEPARAVVLASDLPGFFCAGFDCRDVFHYDRRRMTAFFGRFIELYETLYRLPKPVVAALNGHTFAGGAILAVACDFRVMAEGEAAFALNEINLGLVVTPGLLKMVMAAAGPACARQLLLTGEPIAPHRALAVGLATELAPADQVLPRAVAMARNLAAKPAEAYAEMRYAARAAAGYRDAESDRAFLPDFIERWFSAEAQQGRAELLAKMSGRD